jgi:uncharacterized membrane-anchored protein
MDQAKLYPLASLLSSTTGGRHPKVRARATGAFRAPRQGEWFLSGAIVEAYQAMEDLSTRFYIAELVEVEVKTVERVVRVLHQSDV